MNWRSRRAKADERTRNRKMDLWREVTAPKPAAPGPPVVVPAPKAGLYGVSEHLMPLELSREAERVLYLLVGGKTSEQIGNITGLEPVWVTGAIQQLLDYFNARTLAHLVTKAYLSGYLSRALFKQLDKSEGEGDE